MAAHTALALDSGDIMSNLLSFDDLDLPVYFGGEVKRYNGDYIVPFCVFTDKFDSYLQIIDGNITEGFILPNNLYPTE